MELAAELDILIKILLACLLGGMIGLERESINRPAGLRTHILVTVGSTIVMMINIMIVSEYAFATPDPGRFGAAVISGIGFLGAGTILKEGNTVRGLTTAASIWAVACIGLAVGSGYYFVSIIATFAIFIILETVSRFEIKLAKKKRVVSYNMHTDILPGLIGNIGTLFRNNDCKVLSMSITNFDENAALLKVTIKYPRNFNEHVLIDTLSNMEGVNSLERLSSI